MDITKYLFVFTVLLMMYTEVKAQTEEGLHLCKPSSQYSIFLRSEKNFSGKYHWNMKKFSDVLADGPKVSSRDFRTNDWYPAVVPGTVLTTLVENKVYPDPYFGDNNRKSRKLIPDMADVGREFYHYWYRTSFSIPADFKGKRIWLKFNGINYRCEIWVNGHKIGNMEGMFNTQIFDITTLADFNHENILAVNIEPVDFPGNSLRPSKDRPGAAGENHNGGNGEIGKNVTMLMTVGWDFTFKDGVRDRNTGIWRDVELFAAGDVLVEDPFVTTDLPLPDTTMANVSVTANVHNYSNKKQKGKLNGRIDELGISFSKQIILNPGEVKSISFTPSEFKQLAVNHPGLWWPINKGPQKLYTLDLSFVAENGAISHQTSTRFGFREITSNQNTPDQSRQFLVNGEPVFIRGTNWIPEAMCRNSEKRTLTELKYTRQAGINMVRFWGGGISGSDLFYQLCDKMGILVWQEFWITGDTQFPEDTALYLTNVANTVKRIRNHPSLAYYVASNESDEVQGTGELIHSLDPTRGYQAESECCGIHDGSPYKYVNPMRYFENTASTRGSRIDGFNPEYGTPALPAVEFLRKMMPEKDLWPINDSVWNYMDGGGFHRMTTEYREAVNQFGKSASIEEYVKKAQFVSAMDYRSIWEVWNYNKFNYGDRYASGFLFWYHNCPEPQVCGRLYDYYLHPTAALYYTQNALSPLHPQFDYLKNTVSVYNDYRRSFKNYSVEASVYNLNAEKILSLSSSFDIPEDGVANDVLKIDFPANISQVHFIKLILKDTAGNPVADSFYWRSKDHYKGMETMTGPAISGFQDIQKLPEASTDLSANQSVEGHRLLLKIQVSNPSNSIAFFNRLRLLDGNGKLIIPVFYTDNYFNLLPGESKQITASISFDDIIGNRVQLSVESWNSQEKIIQLTHLR